MQGLLSTTEDSKQYTLSHLWSTRGGFNQFPLVVRTTDNAQFLVIHQYDQGRYIGICQGHAHLLEDAEVYRKATVTESEWMFANLNVDPPKQENTFKPDDLLKRWMYENGSAKELAMTDYFAAHALQGLIQNTHAMPRDEQTFVSKSYDFAEAMVKERSRRYTQ